MLILGPLGFTAPWILTALAILPVLWWLLRVTPPPPKSIVFPAIRLLRELVTREESPARTPLWLILFRMALVSCLIVGLAGPVLHPRVEPGAGTPLLIVIDNGWASGMNWPSRQTTLTHALDRAEQAGRPVVLVATAPAGDGTQPHAIGPLRVQAIRAEADALKPLPWSDDRAQAAVAIKKLSLPRDSEALWLSDGLDSPGSGDLATALKELGHVEMAVPGTGQAADLLMPPGFVNSSLTATVARAETGAAQDVTMVATAADGRTLGTATTQFNAGARTATAAFDLPIELANDIDRLKIKGQSTAGATVLVDSRWRRKPVGIVLSSDESQSLLSGGTYLKAALEPFGEIRTGAIDALLKRPPALIVLDDPPTLSDADQAALDSWIKGGGVVVRFAGPHLSANPDGLLPVKLRGGDRSMGGSLSWEKPAHLAPFSLNGPFAGLLVPPEVTVSQQVLADPSPDLTAATWASLTDGTPLVTARNEGKGWLVLVHTTAGPDWSNLALSGIYAEMLHRLTSLGIGEGDDKAMTGTLTPVSTLDGFGELRDASATASSIEAAKFDEIAASPAHPPGYYGAKATRRALNLSQHLPALAPLAVPAGFTPLSYGAPVERSLKPWLIAATLLLIAADTLIGLYLKGMLTRRTLSRAVFNMTLLLALPQFLIVPLRAETEQDAQADATSTTLGYVVTGDSAIDEMSAAGLKGLVQVLIDRTSIEEARSVPVHLETDDLAFFPLLYWPVAQGQSPPGDAAVSKLNAYLAKGGMILFDTRDQQYGGAGSISPGESALSRLTARLDIPPLEQMPDQHTLTRSFYLLNEFPGRYEGGAVWVERGAGGHNDGVSSVVVGGNDWAAAWAIDDNGQYLAPLSGGSDRQRELAYRFGVNLVMYALTGNYKSDQVHTPFILERLGQ